MKPQLAAVFYSDHWGIDTGMPCGGRVMPVSGWKRPKTVENILLLTGLLPVMVGYSVVISEAIASSMPSQSFLPAKLCLVCFLAAVMAFSCWGGVLACRWIARRICGVSEAAAQRMKD